HPNRGRDRATAARPPMGGAMSEPRIAIRLNHVAYPTFDTPATVRFYTEVMGFRLVAALDAESEPENGARRRFLHTFFAMASGDIIAFFEVDGLERSAPDGLARWIRHLALSRSDDRRVGVECRL